MALIPIRKDQLLQEIDKKLEEKTNSEPKRTYIGASSIGDDCSRKLWYRYHTDIKEMFSADTIRKFNDGHRSEDVMAEHLRMVDGVELYTHKEDGTQYGFKDGLFAGNYDGIIRYLPISSKWHIWEHKSVNEKKFEKLISFKNANEKTALRNWDSVYYAQAVVYMHYEGLERHYLTASTAGMRDYTSVRTDADPAYAQVLIHKARRIGTLKTPPERIGNKDFYKCKWCFFNEMCHEA